MFKIVRDKSQNWIVQIISLDGTQVLEERIFATSFDAARYVHRLMEWVEN